jgi:hypothetical protein
MLKGENWDWGGTMKEFWPEVLLVDLIGENKSAHLINNLIKLYVYLCFWVSFYHTKMFRSETQHESNAFIFIDMLSFKTFSSINSELPNMKYFKNYYMGVHCDTCQSSYNT